MNETGRKSKQNHDVLGIVNNLMVRTTNHGLPHIKESKGDYYYILLYLIIFINRLTVLMRGYRR